MTLRRWQDSYRARATPRDMGPGLDNHAAWRRFCRETATNGGGSPAAPRPPRYRVSTRNIGATRLALDAELLDARLEGRRLQIEPLGSAARAADAPAGLLERP